MEFWEIVWIYVVRMVLTNAHLGFGGPSPVFKGGITAILGKIFDKVLKWRLTFQQLGGI